MTDRLIDFATSAVQRAHDAAAGSGRAPAPSCTETVGQEVSVQLGLPVLVKF